MHTEQSGLAATHFGNATKLTNPLGNDPLVDNTMDIREGGRYARQFYKVRHGGKHPPSLLSQEGVIASV